MIKHRRKLKSATLPPRNDPTILAHDSTCRQKEAGLAAPAHTVRRQAPGQGTLALCPLPKGKQGLATPRQAAQSAAAEAQGRGHLTSILTWKGQGSPPHGKPHRAQAQGMRDTDLRPRPRQETKLLEGPPSPRPQEGEAPTSPGAEGPRHTNLSD